MFKIILSFLFLITCITSEAQQTGDTMVSQTITYHTTKAGELYFGWSLDNWEKIPDKQFWPKGTFIKDKYPYSKMEKQNDSFSITLSLPKNSNLNYMFWVPIDNKGDSTDGWDTYGDYTYSSLFDVDRQIKVNDNALWMPEKQKKFNTLKSGWQFLLVSLLISGIHLLAFRKRLSYKPAKLFTGLLIASICTVIFIRLEMNDIFYRSQYKIFGAAAYDVLYFLGMAVLFYVLYRITRRISWLKNLILGLFILLIMASMFVSFVNIEIVKQLGKPLNYQWLYYSDFMTGTDAKNAIAYKLSDKLILNISLLFLSILSFGIAYSLLPVFCSKKARLVTYIVTTLLVIGCIYQVNTIRYTPAQVDNPVLALMSSIISAGKQPPLFSMAVSKEIEKFIEAYHSEQPTDKLDSANTITNVILFVLESTPKQFVSLYDSTYNVTPNMLKWKNISTTYTNMYSHIPSTSNSMVTMISSLYPLISYKSIINEFAKTHLPSVSTNLKNLGWSTSFFSSADLTFGNMDEYAKDYDFSTTGDSKTISCSYPRFQVTNTLLDGLDDRCISNTYNQWYDSLVNAKKFSILWTNQPHYPYFVNAENEINYVNGNPELNRYLNALKSADEAFGILMQNLQQKNALNNTMVIVVGDHGEAFGTHNQTGHGSKIYEENVNVPCIIYNPILCKGNTVDDISGLIDIAPTIVHVLGLKRPTEWQGKSLFTKTPDGRTFFICPYSDFLLGTRSGDWKYIYNATIHKAELYNLKNDPKELNNVVTQFPDIAKREYEMIGAWVQYHSRKLKGIKAKNQPAPSLR